MNKNLKEFLETEGRGSDDQGDYCIYCGSDLGGSGRVGFGDPLTHLDSCLVMKVARGGPLFIPEDQECPGKILLETHDYLVISHAKTGLYYYTWEDHGFPHTSGYSWTEKPEQADKFPLVDKFDGSNNYEKPIVKFAHQKWDRAKPIPEPTRWVWVHEEVATKRELKIAPYNCWDKVLRGDE